MRRTRLPSARDTTSRQLSGVRMAPPWKGSSRIGDLVEPYAGDEVTGQPDAFHGEVEPLSHLDEDEGQRDGNSHPAVQHVGEKAVPRVEVVVAISLEALLGEQILPQPVEPLAAEFPPPGWLATSAASPSSRRRYRSASSSGYSMRESASAARGEIDVGVGALDLGGPGGERRIRAPSAARGVVDAGGPERRRLELLRERRVSGPPRGGRPPAPPGWWRSGAAAGGPARGGSARPAR